MKKIWLLLIFMGVLIGCTKQIPEPDPSPQPDDVTREFNAFAINFSGTWCGPCGASGIPAITSAATTYGTRLNVMKVGFNDEFSAPGNSDLVSAYYPAGGTIGIPGFSSGTNFFGSSPTSWRSDVDNVIQTPDLSVKVGLSIRKKRITIDSIYYDVKMKAFESLPIGIYAWSVFVIEDNLLAPQAGLTPSPYNHKFVYRGYAQIPGRPSLGLIGHHLGSNPNDPSPEGIPVNKEISTEFVYARPILTPMVNTDKTYAYVVMYKVNSLTFKPETFINSSKTK
jgi:hypothetical protein